MILKTHTLYGMLITYQNIPPNLHLMQFTFPYPLTWVNGKSFLNFALETTSMLMTLTYLDIVILTKTIIGHITISLHICMK